VQTNKIIFQAVGEIGWTGVHVLQRAEKAPKLLHEHVVTTIGLDQSIVKVQC